MYRIAIRNGAQWSSTTLTRLLRDPIAKGLRRSNYTKSTGEGKHWELKSQDDWVFTKAPAIVSEEVWNEVNQILDEMALKHRRTSRKGNYLFSGYISCHCGTKMYVRTRSVKYSCAKCLNKIHMDDLEEIFREQLRSFIYSEDEIQQFLSDGESSVREKENQLKHIQSEADEIRKKLDQLMELFHNGEIPKEGFNLHYTPLFEQLKQINEHIPALEAEIAATRVALASNDQVLHETKTMYHQWPQMSFEEKKLVVERYVDEIIVDDEDITITLNYLPVPLDNPPLLNDSKKVTQPQGFILAIKTKADG
ncbi:MAG: recombinase family protein [Bacteroidota bacterium]